MKSLFQIALLILLIFISFVFYNKYFKETNLVKINKNKQTQLQINKNEVLNKDLKENRVLDKENDKNKKNLIKNLKYKVEIPDSGQYEIASKYSEVIILENGTEIILMNEVSAIYTDKLTKVFINSDNAKFNSENYDTLFWRNIKIYEDNLITSEKLHFNFIKNILVYENVIYTGLNGKIQTIILK